MSSPPFAGESHATPRATHSLALTCLLICSGCSGASQHGDTDPTALDFVEQSGMMLVPAGAFWRGCNRERAEHCEGDPTAHVLLNTPYRQLQLSEFWIDKYEVTVEDYRFCTKAGVCTSIENISAKEEVRTPEVPRLPVTGVNWKQAEAYCRWAGKRLPTEAEWEKAARGSDGQRYPWGHTSPGCGQAHVFMGDKDCRVKGVLPVDSHPGDVSPYGVVGMLGNVQEWVQDWAATRYYQTAPDIDPPGPTREEAYRDTYKVVRGHHWESPISWNNISTSLRRWQDWEHGAKGRIGFRCARSEAPP